MALTERLCNRKDIVCLVGGGGKTTLMGELAERCARRGRNVLVTTTTHIFRPAVGYAETVNEAKSLWKQGRYVVIGTPSDHGKLTAPSEALYNELSAAADVVLIEADGSKRHPVKVPAPHEPVIPDACTLVIGVMGLSALGHPIKEVCFRYETHGEWLNIPENAIFDEETAANILCDRRGTRKNVDNRDYLVVLNQCDDEGLLSRGTDIINRLKCENIPAFCTHFSIRK